MRSKNIQADILAILNDGKVHSMQDIANQIESCRRTVIRHIQSLSFRYNIETFVGGDKKGGVQLIKKEVSLNGLSDNDLQQIITTLQSLQDCSIAVKTFAKRLQLHIGKEN